MYKEWAVFAIKMLVFPQNRVLSSASSAVSKNSTNAVASTVVDILTVVGGWQKP